ncbi:hypothetical protein BGX20_003028 [Mortierella sp. AD010]|nr:hypothetical protein BGX20_003028 [Mortierella sp. AD010]
MTFLSLKAASALALALAIAHAAPLAARCVGSECNQAVDSGNVNVGSRTNITPITNITPVTRYQPLVQAYAPIVQSECDTGLDDPYYGNLNFYGRGYSSLSNYGLGYSDLGYPGLNYWDQYRRFRPLRGLYGNRRYFKRDDKSESQESGSGSLLFSQFQNPKCQDASQEGCETSVPAQHVDLGSHVSIQPTNQVYPSTTYQSHVQSLDANIEASQAQSNNLPQQNVDLGSNVSIQPTTKVTPQTTYQPSVNQLQTSIEAADQEDQSLPQSSVRLGSQVSIVPNVQVHPLTTFQPSITSLPFIINSEPCESSFDYSSTLYKPYDYSSTSYSNGGKPYDYSLTSYSDGKPYGYSSSSYPSGGQPYDYSSTSSYDSSQSYGGYNGPYGSESYDKGYHGSRNSGGDKSEGCDQGTN